MKVFGRWMPALGLATCLVASGCKKEEPARPVDTGAPPVLVVDAGAPPELDAGAPSAVDADAAPAPGATPPAPSPAPSTQAVAPENPKNREWTAGVVDIPRSSLAPVTLREVREARNEGFDRVVFEFNGDQVPGYHLQYIDAPVIKCGSGDPTTIAGQGRLEVRLMPAQAHAGGKATVTARERKPDLPVLAELEVTCDFEGENTWVLGVKHPNKYRVMELQQPTRLVVDVQH